MKTLTLFLFLLNLCFNTSGSIQNSDEDVQFFYRPSRVETKLNTNDVTIVNYTSDVILVLRDSANMLDHLSYPSTTSYASYFEFGPNAYLEAAAAIGDGSEPWPENEAIEIILYYNNGLTTDYFYLTEFMYYFFYPQANVTGPVRIEIRKTIW
ncbi:hypothetical protein ABDK00_005650 [Niabella insulamsoli]|uniref:hypothetical protein n=1 Tax=Niabella insulamsoli TaxID=3144874 RepID=UPI0031FD5309